MRTATPWPESQCGTPERVSDAGRTGLDAIFSRVGGGALPGGATGRCGHRIDIVATGFILAALRKASVRAAMGLPAGSAFPLIARGGIELAVAGPTMLA